MRGLVFRASQASLRVQASIPAVPLWGEEFLSYLYDGSLWGRPHRFLRSYRYGACGCGILKVDPWDGELSGGRLYGRGASDMKSGVAGMVKAFEAFSSRAKRRRGAALVLTGGEEGGDEGSRYLAGLPGVLPRAGALVVGEPTGNYPFIAHKGALWLSCTAAGMAAHGSMPEKGENAIYKACEAILKLRDFDFKVDPHPILGKPTMNVGTIRGGMNVNSVPDQAVFTADIRTLPGMAHEAFLTLLADYLGPGIGIGCIVSPEAVSSQPDTPWIQGVFSILERFIGERPLPRGLNYFTDASVLKPAMGNPQTVILGPGEASEAHRTDEWVSVDKLSACVDIYLALLEDYCIKPHKEETVP
jgi:succinyl-diaminopimelate desuccinylase